MSVTKVRRVSRTRMIFLRLQHAFPEAIYAQLLAMAERKGYKRGFAAFKFKEIFGHWPQFNKPVEPANPSSDLQEWMAAQRRNYGNRMKRLDEKQAKANAFKLLQIEAILADIVAADRESGGIYRDTYPTEPFAIVDRIERKMVENGAKGYIQTQEAAE